MIVDATVKAPVYASSPGNSMLNRALAKSPAQMEQAATQNNVGTQIAT
jgi:hypothetical protein